MRYKIMALLMMFSGAAFGANERSLKVQIKDLPANLPAHLADDPITTIEPGTYHSQNGYFGSLVLSQWTDEYKATATVEYSDGGSNSGYVDVDYQFAKTHDNVFEGTGFVRAMYQNGVVCSYPVSIVVKAFTSGLYIKGSLPESLPPTNSGTCGRVRNIDVVHDAPYTLDQ